MSESSRISDRIWSVQDIKEALRRYWAVVLTVFIAGTLGMWVAMPILFTDMYESQSRVLVKIGRENAETPASVQNGQVFSQGVRLADINSEVQMLSSRGIVETVVDQLGPDAFKSILVPPSAWWQYPKYWAKLTARQLKAAYKEFLIQAGLKRRLTPREEVILGVSKGVKVEPIRDSDVLTIKVRTPSSKLSVDLLNGMLEEYLRCRIEARRNSAGSELFAQVVSEKHDRLMALTASRAAVRERFDLSSPDLQRTKYLEEQAALQAELVRYQARVAELNEQSRIMRSKLASLPPEVGKEHVEGRNPALQPMIERLTELKMERAKIASRYLDETDLAKKSNREISDLESALGSVQPTIVSSKTTEANPERRRLEASVTQQEVEIAGVETRMNRLARHLADLRTRILDATRAIDDLEAADREHKRVETEYLAAARRLEEARMSEILDDRRVANVVAVGPPETPIEPIAPNRVFYMEVAMVISLLLGIALSVLMEATEDRIRDAGSLEEIPGCRYLGTIELGKLA